MKNEYERTLSRTEGERHFIYIGRAALRLFPSWRKSFTLRVGERKLEAKLDRYQRIWTAEFRDCLGLSAGKTVLFKKNEDNSFSLDLKV